MEDNFQELETEEFLDNETGEKKQKTVYVKVQRFSTDAETGEPTIEEKAIQRRTFHVPLKYLQTHQESRSGRSKFRRKVKGFYFPTKKIQSNFLKESFTSTRKNVGPIVFMLPTLLIFPAWASVLCLLGEACMHLWSHERNKRKKNAGIEYRSPLHLISSQFCVHCRSQKWNEKICEIQYKRTLRRKVIYPNALRRVVK